MDTVINRLSEIEAAAGLRARLSTDIQAMCTYILAW